MSNSKLVKYLDRPVDRKLLVSQPVLVSNSLGKYLRKHLDLLKQFQLYLHFECRPGARFTDFYPWLNQNLRALLEKYNHLTLYIWLGTCDVTRKSGKFISLLSDNSQFIVDKVVSHIDRYISIVKEFKKVKLVFLEIPPYSIVEWNRSRGHSDPESFLPQDKELTKIVDSINLHIRSVNNGLFVYSPRFKLDVLKYRKEKDKTQRVSFNFKLYLDGVHPSSMLARVWLKRLIENICVHCS